MAHSLVELGHPYPITYEKLHQVLKKVRSGPGRKAVVHRQNRRSYLANTESVLSLCTQPQEEGIIRLYVDELTCQLPGGVMNPSW